MQYLKSKSLVGDYEHVLRDDPALDQKAEGFAEAYERALETGDFKAVPRQNGVEPAVWRLRHLTGKEWRLVQDVNARYGLNSACFEACALALKGVRGVDIDVERSATSARRGFEAVTDEQMDSLASAVVNELGLRVFGEQGPRNG